ncbi:hypothetical protein CC85DRAFT_82113 [Cutaneotrichosporon oleaginosum]|uniref:Uncharacterized protein n=1 Tax=Cutaneotrichosporon oleaginosum TaxID=879819 RepID=A0A0J0XNH5_9TREE|nr:uncharacterized protein CC85DRAFT_82113 [Cutaneotrichosporon oleaginosum]KLT42671.1 hypothetical protein CC85DRAFT_82113 [Cutaneotrichosporon oleaginosum]TXT05213.1 hypothetical protein COLE_06533 [Cutaneotrichosporon oleaginosum]
MSPAVPERARRASRVTPLSRPRQPARLSIIAIGDLRARGEASHVLRCAGDSDAWRHTVGAGALHLPCSWSCVSCRVCTPYRSARRCPIRTTRSAVRGVHAAMRSWLPDVVDIRRRRRRTSVASGQWHTLPDVQYSGVSYVLCLHVYRLGAAVRSLRRAWRWSRTNDAARRVAILYEYRPD